jgi:transglutaminase-like putative cysteine protease
MISSSIRRLRIPTLLLFLAGSLFCGSTQDAERLHFSLAMGGRVFGYYEVTISRVEDRGRTLVLVKESGRGLSSALGAEIDTKTEAEYRLDPETWRLVACQTIVDQGTFTLRISASVEGEEARIKVEPGGAEKAVKTGPEVVFENPVYFPHLRRDFGEGGAETKSYRVLDLLDRRVRETTYTKKGVEPVELAGQTFRAIVLDCFVPETGLKLRLWVDEERGRLLRMDTPRVVMALAEKSAASGLVRASLDDHILAKAGARIDDINAISYMKVRAALGPVGNPVTPESLNVPGQRFEGTVDRNAIEGIFEVRHPKYDGKNAPPYPLNLAGRTELEPFLAPEDFIESDDPVLIEKAKHIAAGAADSWDAARRLSLWVAENIGYDIPGGASARNTYDLKEGECGAHSRLMAAFCRAVGIPARVVWGCMYVPNRDGSFGQHAWNEIYMGKAGWIPIDTTARQIDYADSGHIRLGILASAQCAWNPRSMTILDFQAGPQKFGAAAGPDTSGKYEPYLGAFSGPRGEMTVFVQGGGLAVKLADGRTFGLRDADKEGRWYLKLTRDVDVTFDAADSGRITGLVLANRVRIPKRSDTEEIPGSVPENLRPYLGRYPIPMQKQDITVLYRNSGLALLYPRGRIQRLEGPDADGIWSVRPGTDRFSFVRDDEGTVRAMILYETVRCQKIRRP